MDQRTRERAEQPRLQSVRTCALMIEQHHYQAHTQPGQQTIPASCRTPASRHSRCSAQARASGLAGAERAKTHSRSTRTTPRNLTASRGEAEERQHMKGGAPCLAFCESHKKKVARRPTSNFGTSGSFDSTRHFRSIPHGHGGRVGLVGQFCPMTLRDPSISHFS